MRGYPGQASRVQVSAQGGEWPLWSADGTTLFFCQSRRLLAVDFDGAGSEPIVGRPREVLRGFEFGRGNMDLLPDGTGVVLVQPATSGVTELRVVTDWARQLEDLVPGARRRP